MRATGLVRRIDPVGRIGLPTQLRRQFGISPGTPLEFLADEGGVLALRKWAPRCAFCGGTESVLAFRGRHVCRGCAAEAARKFRSA